MKFILENTYIFANNIELKFDKLLRKNIEKFNKDVCYRMIVSFDVDIINEVKLDDLKGIIVNKTQRKIKEDDIISEAMSSQLDKFQSVLKSNGIESYFRDIRGDNLNRKDCVEIEFEEDYSEPAYNGRGKNKKRIGVCGIAPNMPGTRARFSKFINDRANKVFDEFMEIIHSKKMMSEILDIEITDDEDKLLRTFASEYWDLVFPFSNSEEREAAVKKLEEQVLAVINKYYDNEDKKNKVNNLKI